MLRMMCGITLRERFSNADVRKRFGIECVGNVIRRCRLRWFGLVECKKENDWAKRNLTFEVAGKQMRGRPQKTWMEVVKNVYGARFGRMRRIGISGALSLMDYR